MWTKTKTLLSLLEWCEVTGINPYLMAQISEPVPGIANSLGQCERPFFQSASQGAEYLSREDIATAISQAEQYVADYCLTWPAPKFESYPVIYPRPQNLSWFNLWTGASGRVKTITAKYGNIISPGVYSETLIDDAVTVTPANPYADDFNTVWSVSVTVPTGTVASEVVAYFVGADIPAPYSRTDCEIKPISVSISGTTATIQGQMVQLVKIANYLKLAPSALDATAAIYATTIDVYRRTIDLAQSGELIWDNTYCPDPPCTYTAYSACFQATNAEQGYIMPIPGAYSISEGEYTRVSPDRYVAPDRVNLNVISGIPRDTIGRMAEPFKTIVAYLSVGLYLQEKTCGCAQADTILFSLKSMPIKDNGTLEISQPLYDAVSMQFGLVTRASVRAFTMLANSQYLKIERTVNV